MGSEQLVYTAEWWEKPGEDDAVVLDGFRSRGI